MQFEDEKRRRKHRLLQSSDLSKKGLTKLFSESGRLSHFFFTSDWIQAGRRSEEKPCPEACRKARKLTLTPPHAMHVRLSNLGVVARESEPGQGKDRG